MKKSIFLLTLMSFLGLSIFMTSCSDDEDALAPSLSFFGGDYIDADETVTPGATIQFAWLASQGDAKLESFAVNKDGAALTDYVMPEIPNDNYKDTLITTVSMNEGSYVYEFKVTDKDGLTASKTFTITVEDSSSSGNPIESYSAVLMGAQSHATIGSYYDVHNNDVMLMAEANSNQASVDMVYYYGSDNMASLCAPDEVTVGGGSGNLDLCKDWTTKNSTRFSTSSVTATEFDNMTDDSVIATLSGMGNSLQNELSEGDILAFETEDGKKGLIKVGTISTGSDGTININVKVQQ